MTIRPCTPVNFNVKLSSFIIIFIINASVSLNANNIILGRKQKPAMQVYTIQFADITYIAHSIATVLLIELLLEAMILSVQP